MKLFEIILFIFVMHVKFSYTILHFCRFINLRQVCKWKVFSMYVYYKLILIMVDVIINYPIN